MLRPIAIAFFAALIWGFAQFLTSLFTTPGKNGWVFIPVSIISIVLGIWLGARLFEPNWTASNVESLAELEAKGIAEREEFHALRAFEVEEMEDEGRHIYVELDDHSVLFLCGQYLYDWGDNFPSAHFAVIRNRAEKWVYKVESIGPSIESDCLLSHYSKAYLEKHGFPEDGTIYNISYDVIKQEIKET